MMLVWDGDDCWNCSGDECTMYIIRTFYFSIIPASYQSYGGLQLYLHRYGMVWYGMVWYGMV